MYCLPAAECMSMTLLFYSHFITGRLINRESFTRQWDVVDLIKTTVSVEPFIPLLYIDSGKFFEILAFYASLSLTINV